MMNNYKRFLKSKGYVFVRQLDVDRDGDYPILLCKSGGRDVVVKVLDGVGRPSYIEDIIINELDINHKIFTSRISNVVRPLDVLSNGQTFYLVMPKMDGTLCSLPSDIIRRNGKKILSQSIKSLFELHSIGIYHGDIKADNIFWYKDGEEVRVVLGDYGLSFTSAEKVAIGDYVPPNIQELINGDRLAEIDYYQLGETFKELLGDCPQLISVLIKDPSMFDPSKSYKCKGRSGLRGCKNRSWCGMCHVHMK